MNYEAEDSSSGGKKTGDQFEDGKQADNNA
jgi:hypothetical protein